MPVFNFFASLIGQYGWVIALLTLFIRLITSPLVYTKLFKWCEDACITSGARSVKEKIWQ